MKKEDLMKIDGMTDELADKVETESNEELKGYIPRTRFDEVNNAKKNAESLVKERDKQLEDVKKSSGDNEDLKKQIEALQTSNNTAKEEYEAKIKKVKVENAVQMALKDAGAKNSLAVTALLKDLDKAEFGEDGMIKGLSDQIKSLQQAEDSSFLFGEKKSQPAGVTPAGSGQSNPTVKKAEDMTYDEFVAAENQNN